MNTTDILAAIDGEISRLTQARTLLNGFNTTGSPAEQVAPSTAPRRGRPKGSKNKATSFNPGEFTRPKRRSMSPEGKARMAAAQRARWARQHGTVAGETFSAKTPAKTARAAKRLTPAGEVGTAAPAVKRSNRLKKAPARPIASSRTAGAAKKISSKVAVRQSPTKKAYAKRVMTKPEPSRTARRKNAPPIAAVPNAGTPSGASTSSAASAE